MPNLQEVFNRIRETKKTQKEIRTHYKDILTSSNEYHEITEKLRGYKLRKKQMEEEAKAELGNEFAKLEALKKDVELDGELLADLAISAMVKGETVMVTDAENNEYEPVFTVKFKKTRVENKKT
ncbi:MAG: hypothetical protein M1383_04250 [Patescibacteria group bacterium]|nr:hypothetical protein [Patescibacteria group bacterium]